MDKHLIRLKSDEICLLLCNRFSVETAFFLLFAESITVCLKISFSWKLIIDFQLNLNIDKLWSVDVFLFDKFH